MRRHGSRATACRRLAFLAALTLLLAGCASRGQDRGVAASAAAAPAAAAVPATPEDEVLAALPSLAADRPLLLSNGVSAQAEPAYFAASGRHCRVVRFSRQAVAADRRLACQDGALWRWVPNVLP